MADLQKEANERLKLCRSRKADVELDLKEAYFFSAPWRSRQVLSEIDALKDKASEDGDSPSTSLFCDLSGEFVTSIMDTFMPEYLDWARRGPGMLTRQADWNRVKSKVEAGDKQIMQAIRASGFYAAAYQALNPDLAVGTAAMWIDPAQILHHFPVCWGIPVRGLEVNVGPLGEIDDRFAIMHMTIDQAVLILGEEKVPKKLRDGGRKRVAVALGFWRLYKGDGVCRWQYVAMIGREQVDEQELEGEGSCPLIPFRFEPDGHSPFGIGPGIKTLPTARVLDALSAATQDRAEFAVNPPYTFPTDSVTAFDNGIRAGMGYPVAPDAAKDIKSLFMEGDPNAGIYTVSDLEKQARRLFYVDYPQQEGKTPPSAQQWLDEVVKAQRRIGPPGQKFWREGPREVFLRFAHILESTGHIEKVTKEGERDGETVSLEAFNPAVRAQKLAEVNNSLKFAQVAGAVAPQEAGLAIDGLASIDKIREAMGEQLVQLRNPEQVKQVMQQMQQMAQAQQGQTQTGTIPQGGMVQ